MNLLEITNGKKNVMARFVEQDGTIRIYKVENDRTINWNVTTGRRWDSIAKAMDFLNFKGWKQCQVKTQDAVS